MLRGGHKVWEKQTLEYRAFKSGHGVYREKSAYTQNEIWQHSGTDVQGRLKGT